MRWGPRGWERKKWNFFPEILKNLKDHDGLLMGFNFEPRVLLLRVLLVLKYIYAPFPPSWREGYSLQLNKWIILLGCPMLTQWHSLLRLALVHGQWVTFIPFVVKSLYSTIVFGVAVWWCLKIITNQDQILQKYFLSNLLLLELNILSECFESFDNF